MNRIRLGMVGGGADAFIGGVHRIASRIRYLKQHPGSALSRLGPERIVTGERRVRAPLA